MTCCRMLVLKAAMQSLTDLLAPGGQIIPALCILQQQLLQQVSINHHLVTCAAGN